MANSRLNPKVDEFLTKEKKWWEEMVKLREFILNCGLTEELKWNKPCYTFQNRNIVIIQGFKEYCALMFFKGVLLNDVNGILLKPGENSQTQRQIRFTNVHEIAQMEFILKDNINEAIEVEKSGLEVEFKKTADYLIPEELQRKFNEMPSLKTAFEALTPGRQRAYILYFTQAKQSKTRESRIGKYIQHILDGKGIND
nr:YdeI family protein [Lysinibacillus timonensis]